ncbi:MAG: FAD-dependent monooxygenase [Pseudomonadota bacterium]
MIVVVGAGIAGLSAALALAPFGDVMVLERRSEVAANAGAGIQLSPNAVKALDAIGARAAVESVAARPEGMEIIAAGRRRPTLSLNYGAEVEQLFGAPYLTVSRAGLYGALYRLASEHPRIAITFERPVERATGTGDGWSVSGERASFLVAADGVNSAIRRALLGDGPEEDGHIAWRGTAHEPGGSRTRLVLAGGAHLVRYALGASSDNAVLVTPTRTNHPQLLARTRLGPAMAGIHRWTPWPIKVRRRHRFGEGTLALVGDASHAMPPFLAQGGAMALEDAAVLGAAVSAHGLTAAARETYEAQRRPRTTRLARQTDRKGLIYHLPAPFSLARDLALARLGPDGVWRQVGWVYAWSPPAG